MYEFFMTVSASIDKTKMTKLQSFHVLFWNLFCIHKENKKFQGPIEQFDWNCTLVYLLNWISLA